MTLPFWKTKTLDQMNRQEWESLCDRCGRCCVHKLEDEESGRVFYTNIACHLFDFARCGCKHYKHRQVLVPACTVLDAENVEKFKWMPPTCAYRLLAEGKPLPWWHPLVSQDSQTIHEAGISMRGKVIPEKAVSPENWEEYVVADSETQWE